MGAVAEIAADVERLGIGGNNPPEPSPHDAFTAHIEDLFTEAANFLDGEPIASEGQANAVSALLDQARKAGKDADAARAAEKKPHDDAGKAVQAKWKPLLDKADLTVSTAKRALAPWLLKVEQENAARAAEDRRLAAAKTEAARAAMAAADPSNLAAQAATEALVKDAAKAEKVAAKSEAAKAHATGGARAVGLRSYFHPELIDPAEALAHYRATQPGALRAFLLSLAETDVANGARKLPGFDVIETRRAV